MEPHFFKSPKDFRTWLEKHYDKETQLIVGFYKMGSGKESITWPQSVEQALCFGWIDGIRRSLEADSYTVRFTPRKPGSIWSAVNINKMEELLTQGTVKPEGIAAYERRKEAKSKIYVYEQEEDAILREEFEASFKANVPAWEFFIKQAPHYRRRMIHHVMTAKQEKTIRSRFEKLVQASLENKRL
jgi:uncharacterized protein YdeI (YjbR/CyaY-like superfamily)